MGRYGENICTPILQHPFPLAFYQVVRCARAGQLIEHTSFEQTPILSISYSVFNANKCSDVGVLPSLFVKLNQIFVERNFIPKLSGPATMGKCDRQWMKFAKVVTIAQESY